MKHSLCFSGPALETSQERIRELNDDGVYLYERGSYAHAQETFQVALTLQPSDPHVLYNLGRCHDQLGQTERAEKAYRQCLQPAPQHAECRHALVVLLANTSRRPDANALVQDWLRNEPKRASPYVEDAWLLLQDGDVARRGADFSRRSVWSRETAPPWSSWADSTNDSTTPTGRWSCTNGAWNPSHTSPRWPGSSVGFAPGGRPTSSGVSP